MQVEANKKQLEKLKLVVRYLDDYKLDPSQLSSFNINQKIAKLEIELSEDDERLKNKRKAQEISQDQDRCYRHSTANQEMSQDQATSFYCQPITYRHTSIW